MDSLRQIPGNVAHFDRICLIVSVLWLRFCFSINSLLLILISHGCSMVPVVVSVQRVLSARAVLFINT